MIDAKCGQDDNQEFGAREVGPLFNISIQTQVDEIYKQRHTRMIFLEFLEACARVAEKACDDIPDSFLILTNKI
jgi:hypothetical protein